jgi:hypothetical protein
MARETEYDIYTEWLSQLQPVGLVLAPKTLRDNQLIPPQPNQEDNDAVAAAWAAVEGDTAASRAWRFAAEILGWPADRFAGAPGGPDAGDLPRVVLSELGTTLAPAFGLREPDGEGWRLLIQATEAPADRRGALEGWEATPRQRFERLLRDSGVATGVLFAGDELVLVHAPKGESSGWMTWPLAALGTVAGRPLLGGLKLALSFSRLWTVAPAQQLNALLRASREAQAEVSGKLSGQILKALHELLRGLDASAPDLTRQLSRQRPGDLYEGILTTLMRLVFVLYAEDRGLLPSATDEASQRLYAQGYGLRGLHERLSNDAALFPDTMEERHGGWGQLLALFRLIHSGHANWITGRGGKLFDPDIFPFLEGRATRQEAPRVLVLSDACVLGVLDALMMLDGERLSYRTLDVEQIGSVYETVMGFVADVAKTPMIAIRGGKGNRVPVFVSLTDLLAAKDPVKDLEALRDGKIGKAAEAIKVAKDQPALLAALGKLIDERGSPRGEPSAPGAPILQPTDERRRSGSHYTPRSLTGPIVEKALEPILRRMGDAPRPDQILDLKLCDPAMGSGAFLVEACRVLAGHLVRAWEAHPGTRPTLPPDEDELLHAKRLVAQRCLYGVDRNPMAVDLGRLSVWLETLARDHEFTFLDHALKCGDSLVGLSRDQIASATWGDPSDGVPLIGQIVRERFAEAVAARDEIRNAPDDEIRAVLEQRHRFVESRVDVVRQIGDAVVACWFAADKDKGRKARLHELESWLARGLDEDWENVATLRRTLLGGEHPMRPFHWEIEFPEVFARDNPGFDVFVGNPPFIGGSIVSDSYGEGYHKLLIKLQDPAFGKADLVAFFFRNAYSKLRGGGCFGFLSTKSIREGATRQMSLEYLDSQGAQIFNAVRRFKWPGEAAVIVAVVHISKGFCGESTLDGSKVEFITPFLLDRGPRVSPETLSENDGIAFSGINPNGKGFVIDRNNPLFSDKEAIARGELNYIKPYIGSVDFNNSPELTPDRFIIDTDDLSEGQVQVLESIWAHLYNTVRVERSKNPSEKLRSQWWKYSRPAADLRENLKSYEMVLVMGRHSTHYTVGFVDSKTIFSDAVTVFLIEDHGGFGVMQSSVHELWAKFNGSSIKDDPRYIPEDCFLTFPFPAEYNADLNLKLAGQAYHDHRATLMVAANEGMTKTYNRFHNPADRSPAIVRLRELHAEMDAAVLRAYGWDDLAVTAQAQFLNEADEPEYAYQGRLFWAASFRDQVLARLLDLNRDRAARVTLDRSAK